MSVWPEITSDQSQGEGLQMEGNRAVWGLEGEYLFLWNWVNEAPRLSVYVMENLRDPENKDKPLATKHLCAGLVNWKAQMLNPHPPDGHINIPIYELGVDASKRFLIWNAGQDVVLKTIRCATQPQRSIDTTQFPWAGLTAQDIIEVNFQLRPGKHFVGWPEKTSLRSSALPKTR